MKITAFLLLAACLQISAKGYSQRVTLSEKEASLETVFKLIEKQTGYTFYYKIELLTMVKKVEISVKNTPLSQALFFLFKDLPFSYNIVDKNVIISQKNSPSFQHLDSPIPPLLVDIHGRVIDSLGNPLAGASVRIKGQNKGTATDENGNFLLTDIAENATLIISFTGYDSREIKLRGKNSIVIKLSQNAGSLEEVQVIGYGTQKKKTVTGAISSVSSEELVQTPVANISNALVGRVPGLFSTQSSGEPGDNAATLRIRGIGTLNSSGQDPLVIIDGVQSTFSIMNAIDANEIENISVLKDASATAVYGVRGANGVIIITTKRGRAGKPQISFSYNYGITKLASRLKMVSAYEYALFRNEAISNDNDPSFSASVFTEDELWKFKNNRDYTPAEVDAMNLTPEQKTALQASPALYYGSHDYFKEQFGATSPQQQYNLNISGGQDKVRYFTSIGYFSQNGVFNNSGYGGADVNSFYKRYNFRSNYDIDVLKNLKITVDISGQFGTNGGVLGNVQDGDITSPYGRHKAFLVSIFSSQPFSGPGIVDGKLVSGFVNNTNPLQSKGPTGYSPATDLLTRAYLTSYTTNLDANVKLIHTLDYIVRGLSITGTVSYNDNYTKGIYRLRPVPTYVVTRNPSNPAEILYFGGAVGPTTIIDNYNNNKWRRLYFEAAVNYIETFGKHAVTGLLLLNAQKTFDPGLLYNVPSGLVGSAGRVTYNYNQRYLAEVDLGYNGSENFPEGKRFGFFPAYSAGWIISNEPFFPKNKWVTWLKVRGSYGEVGNDQIGGSRYLYLPNTWAYGAADFPGYNFGNSNGAGRNPLYVGAYENRIGNPNVTWERARKSNIGLEINLLKSRLSFVGDIFREERSNILFPLGTVPATVGATLPPANIGRVSNKGYELQLGWTDRAGDVSYSIRANVSYAKNKILYEDEPPYPYPWLNQTGFSIGQYKGLRSAGFYNTKEEANSHPNSNIDGNKVQAGDIRYVDINGDGIIDAKDNVPIGYSNLPRYAFSSTLGFGYKGFTISILFIGTAQGSFPLTTFYFLNPFYSTNGAAMQFQYDGRWTPEKVAQGIIPTFPRASLRSFSTINGATSDFWLKSTDFIRLKNVEISYTFSKLGALSRAGRVRGIRVYINGNNLYTWSHLISGIDPEQQDSGGASAGYLYPLTRIFNFGTTVQF